jgi:hypothetical protein
MRTVQLALAALLLAGCRPTVAATPPGTQAPPVTQEQLDLFKISDRVFDRYFKLGYDKLSPPEKVFVCVWDLEAQVNNGGFHQYYFNSSGDHALDTVDALAAIGAKYTAGLVKQANALFGAAGPCPIKQKDNISSTTCPGVPRKRWFGLRMPS